MRLEQKYFVPFIAVGAVFTMMFIVFSSFNFKEQQGERFTEYTLSYDSLLTVAHPYISNQTDSLKLEDLGGRKVMVLFWASWSDKSAQIMDEIQDVSDQFSELEVVAALVKDVTNDVDDILLKHDFKYIDGTILFNRIRVPGIPSYVLLDEQGELVSTHVGFREGSTKEVLTRFME